MKLVAGLGMLLGLLGWKDFSNRVYDVHEPIPLRPFVMQVTRSDFEAHGHQALLKVWVYVFNQSSDRAKVSLDRFNLRLTGAKEGIFQPLGKDQTVTFDPGRSHAIPLNFEFPMEFLPQRIDLIVSRMTLNGKESLALVRIRKSQKL